MNCILCPSTAVADGLCVPCGAKAWVANARLTNKAEDLATLDKANSLDAERLKACDEIKDIGNALAFEHSLIFAKKTKEARKAQELAGDT